jgi:glutathione S-transferase
MNDTIPAPSSFGPEGIDAFQLNVFGWPWTGLVTLLSLLVVFVLAYQVGAARRKYKVAVPNMTGPEEFVRIMRAHANSVEYLVLFIPLLWITALASRDDIAAIIGVFWPLSRIMYAMHYYQDAKKRFPGFVIGITVLVLLFTICAIQIVRSLFIW